ncbi:S-adenosyl-L-methionine-dependent methyltransferase [Coniophora puteana RWD-64-598 SS2]|uniref:S-adenosyl-L-methionine-dependent methyltransferase n=1 Tax=Coniophora puteana (strain RWD-64-598) TaxID=741705 RepID=A0A5M3MBJ8_CONPW|nr:S-adenosyl-L-methionine-dependent methyltransferase [Coniophora puteana RWD-64-598 SS2]EIW76001.1 S-adenosyl-L-methionine-dependent methyltransferase [Coniophora puteana RWD-64-598 SS2]
MSEQAKVLALLSLINSATTDALALYTADDRDVPDLRSTVSHPLDTADDTVALKKAIRTLEGACQQLCATLAPPQHTMVGNFDWACIRVVVEHGIADILDKFPSGLYVDELAAKVGMIGSKLARVLRPLASKGCFIEVSEDVFANNRLSLHLRTSEGVAGISLVMTKQVAKGAHVLTENLAGSRYATSFDPGDAPCMQALDHKYKDTFELLRSDVRTLELSCLHFSLTIPGFPWQKYNSVVDLGSGVGSFSRPLAKRFSHMQITCHDLPEVIEEAKDIWSKDAPDAFTSGRVTLAPLNFFEQVPESGRDVYYLRYVLHDWHDPESIAILRNVREAMAPHSRLLIQDYVLRSSAPLDNQHGLDAGDIAPEPLLPNFGAGNARMYSQDLTMFFTHNARERTMIDFINLANQTGFLIVKVWDLAETCLLELEMALPK